MSNKIAIRIKPLNRWSDVSNASRHGKREDKATHVNRLRTHLNMHFGFKKAESGPLKLAPTQAAADIQNDFKDMAKAVCAQWRRGAIVGTELMWLASPAFFEEALDPIEQAKSWAQVCIDATLLRYPDQVACARLDLDEKTPHLSLFLLPTYSKKYCGEQRKSTRQAKLTISHNTVFGTPDKLSALQDWAASTMQAANIPLARGVRKATKGPDHTTPAEGRRLIELANKQAKKIVVYAEAIARDQLIVARDRAATITEHALKNGADYLENRKLEIQEFIDENQLLRVQIDEFNALLEVSNTLLSEQFGEEFLAEFQAEVIHRWETHQLKNNHLKPGN